MAANTGSESTGRNTLNNYKCTLRWKVKNAVFVK